MLLGSMPVGGRGVLPVAVLMYNDVVDALTVIVVNVLQRSIQFSRHYRFTPQHATRVTDFDTHNCTVTYFTVALVVPTISIIASSVV